MQFHNPLIMGNLFHFIFKKDAVYGWDGKYGNKI
jgi:hypothetical protein